MQQVIYEKFIDLLLLLEYLFIFVHEHLFNPILIYSIHL